MALGSGEGGRIGAKLWLCLKAPTSEFSLDLAKGPSKGDPSAPRFPLRDPFESEQEPLVGEVLGAM